MQNDLNHIATQVCKSIRRLGLSASKEHQIENNLMRQLESCGPEFVISRMKELKQWRMDAISKETYTAPPWHKHSKGCRPKPTSWESQLWVKDDKTFFCLVGAILQSIELADLTKSQANKWVKGVRCERESDTAHVAPLRASEKVKQQLENRLEAKWHQRQFFSPADITATRIPTGDTFMKIHRRNDDPTKVDIVDLYSAWIMSVNTASPFALQFIQDINYCDPRCSSPESQASFDTFVNSLKDKQAELAMYSGYDWKSHSEFNSKEAGYSCSVGHLGFLQKPGGKLRTVANPNRFNQWCLNPLGEVLGDYVNSRPGVFVKNQQGGVRKLQELLKQGYTIRSYDLSAATDTLDWKSFISETFSMDLDDDSIDTKYPLLHRSLQLFSDITRSEWCVPDNVRSCLNLPDNRISFTVGQALGLRPSFPILSLMEWSAGYAAVLQYNREHPGEEFDLKDPPFCNVGDDFACVSEISPYYEKWIKSMNGRLNLDKTLSSDKYAEFCSQLITTTDSFPTKPRIHLGDVDWTHNAFTFSRTGTRKNIPRWYKHMLDTVSQLKIDEVNTLPRIKGNRLPIESRLVANMLIATLNGNASPEMEEYSYEAMHLRLEQCICTEEYSNRIRQNFVDYFNANLEKIDNELTTCRQLWKEYLSENSIHKSTSDRANLYRLIESKERDLLDMLYSTKILTQVSVPPFQVYDWKSDCRKTPDKTEASEMKRLYKIVKDIQLTQSEDEVEAYLKGHSRQFDELYLRWDLKNATVSLIGAKDAKSPSWSSLSGDNPVTFELDDDLMEQLRNIQKSYTDELRELPQSISKVLSHSSGLSSPVNNRDDYSR